MISLALAGLEKAINAYLKLDPESLTRLAKLEGKAIKVDITDWKTSFFVLPHADGIEISKDHAEQADTTISGTLFNLFKTGCAKGENTALFKHSIEISGDTDVGESIRDVMAKIDIDWEEHLSKVVGDVIAHKVGVCIQRTRRLGRQSVETIRDNIKEYLQQESQQVPSREQVEKYIEDVSTLQNDVDRAEARLERLAARNKKA